MASRKTIQAYAVPDEQEQRRQIQPLTWYVISQTVAHLLLLGAVSLWVVQYWGYLDPFPVSPLVRNDKGLALHVGVLLYGIFEAFIALILGFGCATVPPIFLSSIVPQTPANNVLSWLYAKYGTPGYLFAAGGAIFFTLLEFLLLLGFWGEQAFYKELGEAGGFLGYSGPVWGQSLITLFLFVGFTAWALNRLAPAQLIAAISESQHAATIMRAEKLKDLQFQITYAYGVSLLKADLLNMGVEKFRQLSGEFVAIVADMQQHEATAFRNMAELLEATSLGENMFNLVYGQNDESRQRHKQLMQAMRNAAEYHHELAEYSHEAAQLGPQPMSSSALPAPTEEHVIDVGGNVQARIRERMHVDPRSQPVNLREPARGAPPLPAPMHVNSRSQPVESRAAQPGDAVPDPASPGADDVTRRAQEDAEAIELWRRVDRHLPPVITAQHVTDLMGWKDKGTGQRLIRRWVDIGILEQSSEKRPGRYSRTGKEF